MKQEDKGMEGFKEGFHVGRASRNEEIRLLKEEISCLRSVLSELEEDKNCYLQWLRAEQIAEMREE